MARPSMDEAEEMFRRRITPDTLSPLLDERSGYVVIEGILGAAWSTALRAAAESLTTDKVFTQHRFRFGDIVLSKPGIFELDLHDEHRVQCSAHLQHLQTVGGAALSSALRNALGDKLPIETGDSCAIKMQFNSGKGGCFPLHYDNPGPPCRRALTAIVYLNSHWKPGDGGEIVLQPFLGRAVVVSPRMDRLVLFRSDRVLHRVLPTSAVRYCFSIWFDGVEGSVNADDEVNLKSSHLRFTSWDEAAGFFRQSPLQRVVSRAVYSEAYRRSLTDSLFPALEDAPAQEPMRDAVERLHSKAVAGIMAKLRPLVEKLRERVVIADQEGPVIVP